MTTPTPNFKPPAMTIEDQKRALAKAMQVGPNRWAAFTTPELTLLINAMQFTAVGSDTPADDLNDELESELARRKTTP